MPEELAIAVVVLVVVVWLLVKIFQALGSFIGSVEKSLSDSITRRYNKRAFEKRTKLSQHIRVVLPNELEPGEKLLEIVEARLSQIQVTTKWEARRPTWTREEFKQYQLPSKSEVCEEMDADDIHVILLPNAKTWLHEESRLIAQQCKYPFHPPSHNRLDFKLFPALALELKSAVFEYDRSTASEKQIARHFAEEQSSVIEYNKRRSLLIARRDNLNKGIQEWNEKSRVEWGVYDKQSELMANEEASRFTIASEVYVAKCEEQKGYFRALLEGYKNGAKEDVINRMNYMLGNLQLPRSIPRTWDVDFDEEQKILIVEIGLPDVVHQPPFKTVLLKGGPVRKPLNQTERKEIIPRVQPAILLRVAYEVFRSDDAEVVKLLVLNGWIKFDDPSTGVNTKAYTASLMVERTQIANLNLNKIDPLAAFDSLHGKSAGKLVEIIPIEPTLSLNREDSRFVDAKAVLNTLDRATNLAAMDWQDFEHLIRELFEKVFGGRGAEVKITQASRDRGVDAIVFDPDPIRGGKYVIQAKRYTNTVDVSAVRDLCAVVRKEGASRGILVTTSTYGADAYTFANNEPVTLLNGAQLLGLLETHGYSFRINLQEARKLSSSMVRDRSAPTS
ncbi:MAG: restriction endonuclease [Terriglobales bacterium]